MNAKKQKEMLKKWKTAFGQMDSNKTGVVIWKEYWGWVQKCLKKMGYSPQTIKKYQIHFFKIFNKISKGKYGFKWTDVEKYIKKTY